MTRGRTAVAVALLTLCALPACGDAGGSPSATPASASAGTGAAGACGAGDVPLREDLVGLSAAAAGDRVKGEGKKLRVIGEDGECGDRTDDLRQDRVNVYLEDGTVRWAATF